MIDSGSNKIEDYFLAVEKGRIYAEAIKDIEKELIIKALQRSYGNQIEAARILGINRNTLRSKVRNLNIDVKQFKL